MLILIFGLQSAEQRLKVCSLHGLGCTVVTVLWLLPLTQAHEASFCWLWSHDFTFPHAGPRMQIWAREVLTPQ